MWNPVIFSIGDQSSDMYFNRYYHENSCDESLYGRPAFEDLDDLLCRRDDLRRIIERCEAEIIMLEKWGESFIDCHSFEEALESAVELGYAKKLKNGIRFVKHNGSRLPEVNEWRYK